MRRERRIRRVSIVRERRIRRGRRKTKRRVEEEHNSVGERRMKDSLNKIFE